MNYSIEEIVEFCFRHDASESEIANEARKDLAQLISSLQELKLSNDAMFACCERFLRARFNNASLYALQQLDEELLATFDVSLTEELEDYCEAFFSNMQDIFIDTEDRYVIYDENDVAKVF